MKKFSQTDYVREYNKRHYADLKVQLKKEEMEELNELLQKNNLSKTQFVRNAIIALKKGKDH